MQTYINKFQETEKVYRDGIELEKGVVLDEARIDKNIEVYEKWCNLFTAYPDIFIKLITPSESNLELYFYQKIFLRASMRYRYHYCTAPRAFSKTFISVLSLILKCIFQPGTKTFLCAPKKDQGAKILREKFDEIFDLFPMLRKELISYTTSSDNLRCTFRNGSIFDVVAALDSQRGGRRHSGLIDEVRDHDADTLNNVVLPLMNVDRRTKARKRNRYEPHQAQLYMTSAGTKGSYAYEKLIELFEKQIIDPKTAFVWGCDYRVPMMHGLLNETYLNDVRMSQTYKDESFSREYMSIWTGGNDEAWFDFDKMSKHRKLINPENQAKKGNHKDFFYLLSVDVGRLSCQTVVTVFKVYRGQTRFRSNVVNIYVLGKTPNTKHFAIQALDLKKIIYQFDPEGVIIDGNGLGVGLLDFMVRPSVDDDFTYPAYCSIDNNDYSKKMYPDAIPLLYIMKANASLDGQIHSNCYSRISSGSVVFLVKEQEIKNRLLSTEAGQKKKQEERIKRMLPHEMTTKLFEEMSNLKLKAANGSDIKLEKINNRILKDKFSSLEYGLWKIKELEDEYYKRMKKKKKRVLTFIN